MKRTQKYEEFNESIEDLSDTSVVQEVYDGVLDNIKSYMNEIKRYKILSHEETVNLFYKYENGDKKLEIH